MVLRKFTEITSNQPIFSQFSIFYNYKYFFFQSAFRAFFNHHQRSQSIQEQCSMCCSSPYFLVLLCTHYGPLQCFSTYFRKLKEIGVLQPIFPDYVNMMKTIKFLIKCYCSNHYNLCTFNETKKNQTVLLLLQNIFE